MQHLVISATSFLSRTTSKSYTSWGRNVERVKSFERNIIFFFFECNTLSVQCNFEVCDSYCYMGLCTLSGSVIIVGHRRFSKMILLINNFQKYSTPMAGTGVRLLDDSRSPLKCYRWTGWQSKQFENWPNALFSDSRFVRPSITEFL